MGRTHDSYHHDLINTDIRIKETGKIILGNALLVNMSARLLVQLLYKNMQGSLFWKHQALGGRIHHSHFSHTIAHIFIYSFTPRGNFAQPIHLPTCFWIVGGNSCDHLENMNTQHRYHTGSNEAPTAPPCRPECKFCTQNGKQCFDLSLI